MIKFEIEVSMSCNGFEADSIEDAKDCIKEALSRINYGIGYNDVDWDIQVKPQANQSDVERVKP